ncbi:hypothetical protein Bca52824_051807 [Brassica carinata]|uniref:Uncharacterized protein n=1 Tax=Brassica carinata TaxID=52824 RepID=A0A8X7R376_BRACI|nr:hypothetical protein Bca52824_051807 [Brassica carinata]
MSCKEKVKSMNSDKLQVPSTVTPHSCAFGEASTEVGQTISIATSHVLAGLALPQPQLQGAWSKPLLITGATERRKKNKSSIDRTKATQQTKLVDSSSSQRVKLPTDKSRFPWAARMNPQTRNLHRVTVPEYMEDGTPKVSSETSQEAAVAKRDATLSDIPIPSQAKEAMTMATIQASNSQKCISHAPVSDQPATPEDDTSCICDEVIEKINSTDVDDLVSLATISVLENLYESPTVSAPIKQHTESSVTQTSAEVSKESSRMQEIDLGSNQFAFLTSLEGEEEYQLELDESSGPIDLLTPSGKRLFRERPIKPSAKGILLRERPAKPSAKGMEWQLQSTSRGRGNRGRGNCGRLR